MSNVFAFPTSEERATVRLDRALGRFNGTAGSIEEILKLAVHVPTGGSQYRVRRWLREILNCDVIDVPPSAASSPSRWREDCPKIE